MIPLHTPFLSGNTSRSIKTLIKNLVFLARFFKLCRSSGFLRVLCGFYLALALALWPLFPQCPLWSILVVAQPGCTTIPQILSNLRRIFGRPLTNLSLCDLCFTQGPLWSVFAFDLIF